MGYSYARTVASHEHWIKKGIYRTITFQGADKDIPGLHLKTNCKTMGCTLKDLYDWAAVNC